MLERFNRLIDELVERVRAQPTFGWATVVSVDPLQIRYDGQADPVVGAPSGDTDGLRVGDRVWCQRIHRRDIVLVNRGSGRPYAMAAGVVVTEGAANVTRAVTVTLPVGRFTQAPLVTATPRSGAPEVLSPAGVSNETTASFTVAIRRSNSTLTEVIWHAVQMTPTSAPG